MAEDEAQARDAIRVTTAVYIANKVQNIRDDTLMNAAGLELDEAKPIADVVQREGAQAGARMVTNAIMDKVVIAGTPTQVTDRLLELSAAGCSLAAALSGARPRPRHRHSADRRQGAPRFHAGVTEHLL